MNGITHNQAIKWIHRRQDGLLKEDQQSLLEEHLRSCESCRAYALEMAGFSAHLQNEFHRRWDQGVGPSQNVTDEVMLKARKIPVTNRISSGVRVFAGALALVLLAVVINLFVSRLQSPSPTTTIATETMDISPLPEDRLLAFTSSQNGSSEIYTMHPDGNGLTNITNHPANDSYPFWSPDGKQIAFMSDRDGSPHIYLMDADGSDVIQLTQGEGRYLLDVNGYTPWSPDGRKLIYSYRSPEETSWNLYVLDIDESTSTALTNEPGQYILPSWSPDGEHIAFISTPSDRSFQQIFVVDRYGNDLAHLTETLTTSEFFVFGDYSWSQDGISITFSTHSHGQGGYSSAYKASLDGSLTALARTDTLMVDWWNGTALQHDPDGKTLTWLRSDSSQSALNLCQSDNQIWGIAYRRSQDGNLAFGSNCSGSGWMIYWANPEGTVVHELLDSPLPANGNTDHIFNMTWSPDDRYLAFVALHSDSSNDASETLYIVDVAKAQHDPSLQPLKMTNSSSPSWQPVIDKNLVKEEPTPKPVNPSSALSLIAFTAAGESGNPDIYTIHPDGSGLVNLTNTPDTETSPAWSPDGKLLAFVSTRDGDENIYVMTADGSDLIRLTDDPSIDMGPVWSPDGAKIAYVSRDANRTSANIHVVDSNGQNRRQLTSYDAKSTFWTMNWSPDSQLLFLNFGQQILRVDVSDGNTLPVTAFTDVHPFTDFVLSQDGSKLYFLAECSENSAEFCKRIKSVDMDGTNEETHETIQLERVCTSGGAPLNKVNDFYYATIWSPDRTKIAFAFNCFEYGGLFYVANADGSDFKSLTSYPILYKDTDFNWSPDGKSIIFTSALEDKQTESLYVLSVTDALQNPELRPSRLNVSASQIRSLAWRPDSVLEAAEVPPTPQPTQVHSSEHRIAFIAAIENGILDIYRMRADGSELTNLTNNPAHEMNPHWSPDGKRIAFESDLHGFTHIFIMNADGSGVFQLTDGEAQHQFPNSYPWSPDGSWLLYTEWTPEQEVWTLYAISADGQKKTPLSQVPHIFTSSSWSPDGEQIAFVSNDPQTPEVLQMMIVDPDGETLTDVASLLGKNERMANFQYAWSPDGRSVFFTAYRHTNEGEDKWIAYEADLDDNRLIEKATSSTPISSWWEGTAFITGLDLSTLTWMREDGTYSSLNALEHCDTSANTQIGFLAKRSSIGDLLISVSCPNDDVWLYWAAADGSSIKQLLELPLSEAGFELSGLVWSPDNEFIALNISSPNMTDMYIVNISATLSDPSIQPLRLTLGGGSMFYGAPSWQPAP